MDQTNPIKGALWVLIALFAMPICIAQETAERADEPSRYDLTVKYAETKLRLAEVELELALEIHQSTPNAITRITYERLKSNLTVAKEQFTEATASSTGGPERVQLRHAEEKIRLAKLDLEAGRKLWKEGMISDLEMQRLRLKYDLAKLNVVIISHPESFVTLLNYIEAKVDRMGEEILALDQRISRLEPIRGMLPKSP